MNERSIFLAALDKADLGERAAYLDAACGHDEALRKRLERLLQANEPEDSFLEKAPPVLTPTADEAGHAPGTRIKQYKLLQKIGEGGMGVVYMAEQEEPVRRMVAFKIIRPGMDSKQVLARFEAERQALALMDHPNIARVLDAGTTDTGYPYFVMELVKGIPITRFCDEHQLTPRERLELFLPVCHAVQHAHQKGIIHRDLKPSNVLVALYDDHPVPKVIDFGVAKATSQRLTEKTLFTEFGAVVGTLEYMSPEQAKLNALDIDTRSDVYALGVLLYELLTGSTPLSRGRLKEAALDEVLRLIREEEPPKPSTRLSESGPALAAISARRRTEPAQLGKVVRGELDWIVMKSLEKDRTRRYETASALAKDVERYLKDEPVEACPPTLGYRMQKFARKHKAGLVTAAAFVLLLLAGAAVCGVLAVQAYGAQQLAADQRDVAARQLGRALEAEKDLLEQQEVDRRRRAEVEKLNADLRRSLYATIMEEIQAAWDAGKYVRVTELLDQLRPKSGEEDLRGFEWYYWRRQCSGERTAVRVYSDAVAPGGRSMANDSLPLYLVPDGSRVLVSEQNAPAKMYDTTTGKRVSWPAAVEGNGTPYFSKDGKRMLWLVSGSRRAGPSQPSITSTSCTVFDCVTGKVLAKWPGSTGVSSDHVAFSPDGKRVAWVRSVNEGAGLAVWDAEAGKETFACILPEPEYSRLGRAGSGDYGLPALVFSPDGKELALLTFHKSTRYEDLSKPCLLRTLDAETGKVRWRLDSVPQSVIGVAYNPEGNRLFGLGSRVALPGDPLSERSLPSWDAATGEPFPPIPGVVGSSGVAFSPNGKRMAAWGPNGSQVSLWDVEKKQLLPPLTVVQGGIRSVVFQSNDRLCTAQGNGIVKTWDIPTAGAGLPFTSAVNLARPVYHWESQRLLVKDRAQGQVLFRILGPGGEVPLELTMVMREVVPRFDTITNQNFSPDGKRLAILLPASSSEDAGKEGDNEAEPTRLLLHVLDTTTGKKLRAIPLTAKPQRVASAWCPDNKRLAVAEYDAKSQTLRGQLLDTSTGETVGIVAPVRAPMTGVESPFYSPISRTHQHHLQFSADGRRLVSGLNPHATVWDVATGAELCHFEGLSANTDAKGTLNHDGKLAAFVEVDPRKSAGGGESLVHVFDVDARNVRLTFRLLAGNIEALQFSPDGKRLLTVSGSRRTGGSNSLTLWDAVSGRPLLTIRDTGFGPLVRFAADGKQLVGVRERRSEWHLATIDATPLPPEVEGRNRVFALADRLQTKAEIVEQVNADPHLNEVARHTALSLVKDFVENANRLNDRSWPIAKQPGLKPEAYRSALLWAETSVRLGDGNPSHLNTLGMAQYRVGQYKEALESLNRAVEGHKANPRLEDQAILAMVHHKLGNREEALRNLEVVRKGLESKTRIPSVEDVRLLLAEGEELLKPANQPVHP